MTWTLTARDDAALQVRRSEVVVEGRPNCTETVVEWSGHGHDGASKPGRLLAVCSHPMLMGWTHEICQVNPGCQCSKFLRQSSGPSQW